MRFDISLNNEILFGYPCALLSCVALKMSSVGGDGKEAEVLRARVALLVWGHAASRGECRCRDVL